MCGICGIVGDQIAFRANQPILEKMLASIRHRGPDDNGTYVDDDALLGSVRLSIIDLSTGHMPICNEAGDIWIVFNGEIYNYQSLREYLLVRGHQFKSQSDTEVVVHLYEEFGVECVQHLNGIFAFAIWDRKQKRLFLARDRMGIKPLYYTEIGDQLVFASEMRAILAHSRVKRDIDPVSLNEYLSFEYVPSPRTIITNIFRIPAGCWATYSKAGLKVESYYQLSLARSEMQPPVDWRDYTARLDERLQASIKQELVSDVPVGVLLSGGVDSSTVAAYMAELYPRKVKSFSIGFEEKSFDESIFARRVAKHLGTEHNELILSAKKAGEMVANIADYLDEPFGDSSFIPTFLLSQFARQQVKVALGGDGGDELFAGYPTLIAHKMINYYERIAPWTFRAHLAPAILKILPVSFNNISFDFKVRRFLSGRGYPIEVRHQRWLGSLYDEDKQDLLQDWLKPVLRDTYYMAYHYSRKCDAVQYLNRLLYNDINLYLEGDILFKVDRASMASSLEVRVPLLNRDLVDYISTLPIELKLRGITGKYILKKCVEHRLPSDIINRPKKGFNMPVAHWMTRDLRELVEDSFSETTLKNQGLFKHGFIRKLFDDHLEYRRDNRKPLWTLLVFQLWYAKYIA